MRYINRDPAAEERKKALERKEKMDADDSERAARMVERQIKEAQKALKVCKVFVSETFCVCVDFMYQKS